MSIRNHENETDATDNAEHDLRHRVRRVEEDHAKLKEFCHGDGDPNKSERSLHGRSTAHESRLDGHDEDIAAIVEQRNKWNDRFIKIAITIALGIGLLIVKALLPTLFPAK